MRTLLSGSSVVLYTCRTDDLYATVAIMDSVEQLTGYPSSRFVDDAQFRMDRTHPDDRAELVKGLLAAGAGRRTETQYRIRHADGRKKEKK